MRARGQKTREGAASAVHHRHDHRHRGQTSETQGLFDADKRPGEKCGLGYFANTQHYRSWVRLVARDGSDSQILIAFHVIGHQFQGVLACSGTWFRRVQTDDGGRETEGETPLSDEIFQVNYMEEMADVVERFEDWLEGVVERGLALWESTAL